MVVDLNTLPVSHQLRNSALAEIGAEYSHNGGNTWRNVLTSFGIAKSIFNGLGDVWTRFDWRVDATNWQK